MDEAQRNVRAMSASTFFFGDKLEDRREAAGGTWWTRRREVAEFAEEDKKVKERARLRIRGGGARPR